MSRTFCANGCCQASRILSADAVKTIFKHKGLPEERAALAPSLHCSLLKEINLRPDIPPKCEADLQAVT